MIVSHYDRPRGGRVECELCPQHSLKNISRSQRVVVGQVMKSLGLSTRFASNHRMLVVGIGPTQTFPYHHP
jgi:hypothetical protein